MKLHTLTKSVERVRIAQKIGRAIEGEDVTTTLDAMAMSVGYIIMQQNLTFEQAEKLRMEFDGLLIAFINFIDDQRRNNPSDGAQSH